MPVQARKDLPTRLDDLAVYFVSGVKYPATNKRFFLKKEAKWLGFVETLKKNAPDKAAELDGLLAAEKYDELRRAVAVLDQDVVPELDAILAKMQEDLSPSWEEWEPTQKDLEGIEAEPDGIICLLYKRQWTAEMRQKHQEKGGKFAGPNKSFPISNCEDVHAAYMSAGRSRKSAGSVQKNVVRIAKEMKLTHCLPQTVKDRLQKNQDEEVSQVETQEQEQELEQEEVVTEKAKKKAPMPMKDEEMGMDSEGDGDGDEEETSYVPPKKAKKGILGSMIEAAAKGAGYELAPAGTMEALKHITVVLDAMQAGKSLLKTDEEDDVPAGEDFGFLDDQISFPQRAPADDLHGGRGAAWVNKGVYRQQPDVVQGTPATQGTTATTVQGAAVEGAPGENTLEEGEPVTKSDIAALLEAVNTLKSLAEDNQAALQEMEERIGVVETRKGISHVSPAEENVPVHKSAGVWAGSAFDVST